MWHRYVDRSLNYGREAVRASLLACGPYRSVLDLGAGQGVDLATAAEVRPRASLHGVEWLDENRAVLAERGIEALALDLEHDALPFPDGSLDVVIANQILEHVKNVFWVFHEVSRCLPVGGSFVVGVPNLASLHNRLLLLLGRQPTCIRSTTAHVRGFTAEDIERLAKTCFPGGYEVAGVRGSNFYPLGPALAGPLARALPTFAVSVFVHLVKRRDYDGGFVRYPSERRLETNFYLGPDAS